MFALLRSAALIAGAALALSLAAPAAADPADTGAYVTFSDRCDGTDVTAVSGDGGELDANYDWSASTEKGDDWAETLVPGQAASGFYEADAGEISVTYTNEHGHEGQVWTHTWSEPAECSEDGNGDDNGISDDDGIDDENGDVEPSLMGHLGVESTCDGLAPQIHFGVHEGEYLYSLWHDGELVVDEEQGEANTTTEGLDPVKGELRAKMTYESVNDEGHNLVFDETHDYEAPEDCPPADEAECVTVDECVEALLDDGIITTGAEVYVVVGGVYYLCIVDADGEVAYEEVTEDEATSDDTGDVYRIDVYGVWWCIVDGSWEQVTEVVATTGDESDKGVGDKGEEADGNGGETGTADADPASSGSDSLPVTGAALAGLLAAGLTALGGGGVALYLARKRKAAVGNGSVDDE